MHFLSRLPRGLEVNTAFVNAGVEGTEGLVQVEADRTLMTIFEGQGVSCESGRKPPAHERPVGGSREREASGIDCCGASSGRRPMGAVLSTRYLFSA